MSIQTIRRKLKEGYPVYQVRKVRGENNLYRLYDLNHGFYRGGYDCLWTLEDLENFVADDD